MQHVNPPLSIWRLLLHLQGRLRAERRERSIRDALNGSGRRCEINNGRNPGIVELDALTLRQSGDAPDVVRGFDLGGAVVASAAVRTERVVPRDRTRFRKMLCQPPTERCPAFAVYVNDLVEILLELGVVAK